MGIKRTSLLVLLALTLLAPQAQARGALFGEPLPFFATCTGRLSAQMEFQWLIGAAEASETEAVRAAMVDVLRAMTPPDKGREVLHQRLSAKRAHWTLLNASRFSSDPHRAAEARQVAERLVRDCTSMVLL